ncbi:MAG TPA: hypothetical protein VFM18_23370 [Methanosarcina sp.]|nr:hypothetical protein [Methanosarcina sp.]
MQNETRKVFVTQIPVRRDAATDGFVPTVNISPAAEHGDVIVMMPPRAPFYATDDLVRQLREHLKDYNFERGDSIVPLGDPAIMAAAFALLGSMKGKFTVLKWDRQIGRYVPTQVKV